MTKAIYEQFLSLEDVPEDSRKEISDFICPLCAGVYHKPLLDQCGHMFCSSCIYKAIEVNDGHCPIRTSEKLDVKKLFPIDFINKQLAKMTIYCKNRRSGCTWIGTAGEFNHHRSEECEKQLIHCPNPGCKETYLKSSAENHLSVCEFRQIACTHCSKKFSFSSMDYHLQSCPKMIVQCPLNCSQLLNREDIDNHIKTECENSVMECSYYSLGCDVKCTKKEMGQHINNDSAKHLKLLLDNQSSNEKKLLTDLNELQSRVGKLEKFLLSSSDKGQHKMNHPPLNAINDLPYNKQVNIANSELSSTSGMSYSNHRRINHSINDKFISQLKDISFSQDVLIKSRSYAKKTAITIRDDNETIETNDDNRILNKKRERSDDLTLTEMNYDENIFDLENSFGVSIQGREVKCISESKSQHKFAFLNRPLESTGDVRWKIKIISLNGPWIGFGACNKELLIKGKFKFAGTANRTDHGTYILSSNGYSWNTSCKKEDFLKIPSMPIVKNGSEILFTFSQKNQTLKISLDTWSMILSNLIIPHKIYPCIVFLNYEDTVEFSYI